MWPLFLIGIVVSGVLFTSKARAMSTGGSPSTSSASLPVGLRNNNPTNLKGKGWIEQTGADAQGHAIFSKLLYGLRAAYIDLNTKFTRGDNTVDRIVQLWAGAEAPNISAYKTFVAKRLGVNQNQRLTYATHITPLIKALSEFEVGPAAYRTWNPSDDIFKEARALANKG